MALPDPTQQADLSGRRMAHSFASELEGIMRSQPKSPKDAARRLLLRTKPLAKVASRAGLLAVHPMTKELLRGRAAARLLRKRMRAGQTPADLSQEHFGPLLNSGLVDKTHPFQRFVQGHVGQTQQAKGTGVGQRALLRQSLKKMRANTGQGYSSWKDPTLEVPAVNG